MFSLIITYLCLSFAGLIFVSFTLFVFVLIKIYSHFNIKFFLVTIVLILIIISSFILWNVKTRTKNTSEIVHTIESITDYVKSPKKYILKYTGYKTGNEERLIMWTATTLEVFQHPFGVGTGNVDEHLIKRLKLLCQYNMIKKDYNPHNQFLQTGLEIGIFGLLILLFIIFYGLKKAYQTKNWILFILLLNLFFNSLFESMLQRQSGIVFYTFWICLLTVYSENLNQSTTKLKNEN